MTSENLKIMISDLTDSCRSMLTTFRSLRDILEREKSAIGLSDLNLIEKITLEKLAIEGSIEQLVKKINSLTSELFSKCGFKEKKDPTINDLANYLLNWNEINDAKLMKMIRELSETINDMSLSRRETLPIIESNIYLVNKLLNFHRETYAFWQAVASDSEQTYGKGGKSKVANSRSILSVRT